MEPEPENSDPRDTSDQQSEDQIKCVICFDFPSKPQVTSCCGQIVCQRCISRWLSEKTTCPFCRHPLSSDSLVPIKWLENLKSVLQLAFRKCSKHNKVYEFYCKTCECYLCSHCLFEELQTETAKHKSHEIIKLDELMLYAKQKVQQQLVKVLPTLDIAEKALLNTQIQVQFLAEKKKIILNEMKKKFEQISHDTEKQFQDYDSKLSKSIVQIEAAQKYVSSEIEKIEQILSTNQNVNSKTYQAHLSQLNQIKKSTPTANMILDQLPTNDLVVPFTEIQVYIPHLKEHQERYKNLPEEEPHYFYSSKIKLYGNTWRVKIYPNGNLNGANTHLSVFLELLKGCGFASTYTYKLLIKKRSDLSTSLGELTDSSESSGDICRQYSSEFSDSDSWGWNKVALLETLYNGNYLDDQGGLPLLLSIRAENNYQVYFDWHQAVLRKKDKYKKLKKLLKEAKVKNSSKPSTEQQPS